MFGQRAEATAGGVMQLSHGTSAFLCFVFFCKGVETLVEIYQHSTRSHLCHLNIQSFAQFCLSRQEIAFRHLMLKVQKVSQSVGVCVCVCAALN